MKDTQVRWLDCFRQVLLMIVQQLHLNLGSIVQNQLAHSSLPQILSVLDTIRKLFNSYKTVTDEKTGKTSEQAVNVLELFDTTNTEGVDPTNVRIFETAHPHPLSDYKHGLEVAVPRALGYLVEMDGRCRMGGPGAVLQIKTQEYSQSLNEDFATSFEFRGNSPMRQNAFFVYGPTLYIDFQVAGGRRRGQEPEDANAMLTRWGVRLSIKPLLGTPRYRPKPSLRSDALEPVCLRVNGQGNLTGWFQLLNLMAFLGAALAGELTDGNLIQLQTDGELATGAGIFANLGQPHIDTMSERSASLAGKQQQPLLAPAQLGAPGQPGLGFGAFGTYGYGGHGGQPPTAATAALKALARDSAVDSIFKSDVLNWHLFKGGLRVPELDQMSAD